VTQCGRSLSDRIRGRRVLEMGAGIGLVSLCSAAAGAHVLCTDLPAIVDGILARNISANTSEEQPVSSDRPPRKRIQDLRQDGRTTITA
jgi:predicted nicotinamide N-methyase